MPFHRSDIEKFVIALGISCALSAPAVALAGTGGAAAPGSSTGSIPPGAAVAPSGSPVPSGPVGGPALQTDPIAILGRVVHFRGSLGRDSGSSTVTLERYDAATATWVTAATTTTDSAGDYVANWRANAVGNAHMRVRPAGSAARARSADAPTVDMTVFRGQYATWFGPGFYGQQTACGIVLTPHTLGVAHRTLPCGTPVQILWGGRTITVAVIDRGPYGGRARWDLTEATARALGNFDGNELIGVLRAGPAPVGATVRARPARRHR